MPEVRGTVYTGVAETRLLSVDLADHIYNHLVKKGWTQADAKKEAFSFNQPKCEKKIRQVCEVDTCYVVMSQDNPIFKGAKSEWIKVALFNAPMVRYKESFYIPMMVCHPCDAWLDGHECGFKSPDLKMDFYKRLGTAVVTEEEKPKYKRAYELGFETGHRKRVIAQEEKGSGRYKEVKK